jgi:hypothetical protein
VSPVALGLPSIAYTEGRCAGGGTEINSGLYRRPPADVIERWTRDFRIADLDYDEVLTIAGEVEATLDVGTVPGPPTAPSDVLRRGAERLGWQHGEIPRWMKYTNGGSGQRQSMTRTYLPRAMAAGARIATGCRIDSLDMAGGSARSAATTLPDGRRGTIRFRDVFVCGGAIQSPALLQRSRIDGPIGRSLAVHPTVKLAARFADEVNVPDDVAVHQVKEFAPELSFGGSASQPGLVALALSDQWATFSKAITDWRRISLYYAAITSEGRGRVRTIRGVRDPIVTYGLTRRDRAVLGSGLARLSLLMLEAGADEVYPSFRGAPIVRTPADLATMNRSFSASKASVMTVHLCSTIPMGQDMTQMRCRLVRTRARDGQRVGQRRVLAADRPRGQPAGHGDGVRHPQRPTVRGEGASPWLSDSPRPVRRWSPVHLDGSARLGRPVAATQRDAI